MRTRFCTHLFLDSFHNRSDFNDRSPRYKRAGIPSDTMASTKVNHCTGETRRSSPGRMELQYISQGVLLLLLLQFSMAGSPDRGGWKKDAMVLRD